MVLNRKRISDAFLKRVAEEKLTKAVDSLPDFGDIIDSVTIVTKYVVPMSKMYIRYRGYKTILSPLYINGCGGLPMYDEGTVQVTGFAIAVNCCNTPKPVMVLVKSDNYKRDNENKLGMFKTAFSDNIINKGYFANE